MYTLLCLGYVPELIIFPTNLNGAETTKQTRIHNLVCPITCRERHHRVFCWDFPRPILVRAHRGSWKFIHNSTPCFLVQLQWPSHRGWSLKGESAIYAFLTTLSSDELDLYHADFWQVLWVGLDGSIASRPCEFLSFLSNFAYIQYRSHRSSRFPIHLGHICGEGKIVGMSLRYTLNIPSQHGVQVLQPLLVCFITSTPSCVLTSLNRRVVGMLGLMLIVWFVLHWMKPATIEP